MADGRVMFLGVPTEEHLTSLERLARGQGDADVCLAPDEVLALVAEVRRLRRVGAALAQNLRDTIIEGAPSLEESRLIVEGIIAEASAEPA